jgi:hypothetical protein
LLGTFAVLIIMTSTGQLGARAAPAGAAGQASSAGQATRAGGTTIGPVQISALGHPRLCWEAGGNGSGVTLEHCDRVLQGQQWSLTPDGVLMNGNGYCLEAVPGRPLFIDFAAQCGGAPTQLWHYHSGHLTGAGVCAVTPAPISPGAEITGGTCSSKASAPRPVSRWSIGYSAVTVTPGRGRGPAGGTFTAPVTVANASTAQAAYGVSVAFTLPPGVSASTLRATTLRATTSPQSGPQAPAASGSGPQAPGASGSGLHCDVRTLACTGTLPAGASRQLTLTGPVPAAIRPGDSYPLHVHSSVTGTTQRSRIARTTASLTVTITPAAPHPRSPLPLIAGAAAVLLLAGLLLVLITRRTRARTDSPSHPRPPSRHRTPA